MFNKNKFNENQIWQSVMTVIPFVFLMLLGNDFIESNMRVLISGLLAGVGGMLGFIAYYFTKDKSRKIKIFTSIILLLGCFIPLYFLSSNPSDADLLKQNWITQKIGNIEFDSPYKLKLQSEKIPESVEWFYEELKLFSDTQNGRSISFVQSKIKNDTLNVEDVFSMSLEGMLSKLHINMENVEMNIYEMDYEEISTRFSFKLNNQIVHGYAYVFMKENYVENLWLLPVNRGFSIDFIDEFEAGIFHDY